MIKILLVDDELQLLEITKAFLENLTEIDAETALSAVEAIQMMQTVRYDAVVSDYQMPEMDGIELLRWIRTNQNQIPFILFTGKGREEVVIEALNAGADFYLQKGGDPRSQFAELSNMIEKAIQRRRMEEELIENEEKFKNIFNSANDAIYILDLDGRFLEINDVGCMRLGFSREDMLRKRVSDVDSDQYAAHALERINDVMEKGFALFEVEWVTKSGALTPSEISARKINYAGRPAILSVARDITERKRNQEILLEKEIKFSTVADFTYDWEYWVAPEGSIIYCSPSCKRISGYSSDELSSDPRLILDMVHPEDRHLLLDHYQRENKAEPSHFDFRIITRKGETRWIAHNCQAVHDEDGKYLGRRVSNRDITERKQAEEELWENEKKLSLIMDNMTDTVWLFDLQFKFVWMSPSVTRGSGYTLEEFNSIPIDRQMEPHSFRKVQSAIGTLLTPENLSDPNGQANFTAELEFYKKGGGTQWIDVVSNLLRDEQGRPTGILMVGRDVTDRVREANAHRMSETRFRELFDNIDSGIVIYEATPDGSDFIIRDFNAKAEKIEGVRKQDVVGKAVTKSFPGAVSMGIVEALRSVWKTGRKERLSGAIYTDAGKGSSYRENLIFKLPNGELVAIYGDVTEQRKIEDELRLTRGLFNESIAAMGMSDEKGIMTDVNESFLKYLGYSSKEEILGRPTSDFMSSHKELVNIMKAIDAQGKWQGEYHAKRKDGSTVLIYGLATALKDETGKTIGYHSTAIDITEHKSAQDTSSATNVKLNLLSNITVHDIQNQVVVLNGLVYKAKHANSPVQVKEYLGRIQGVADKIQSHVAFAREYQNLGKAPPSWIRLDNGIQDLTSKFDSKWVQFEVDLGSLEVFSDAMLNRAFYNLIDDTLKHGQKATRVRFSAKPRGEDLVLLYEDNGVGVPIERKRSIFEKSSSAQKVHGLVLVREILGITGMTIVENGEPGKGARFEIVVPKGNFRYAGSDKTKP